jgi:hypothetical protein
VAKLTAWQASPQSTRAQLHIFLSRGVAHQSYAPDLASEGTKTRADFEVKLLQ